MTPGPWMSLCFCSIAGQMCQQSHILHRHRRRTGSVLLLLTDSHRAHAGAPALHQWLHHLPRGPQCPGVPVRPPEVHQVRLAVSPWGLCPPTTRLLFGPPDMFCTLSSPPEPPNKDGTLLQKLSGCVCLCVGSES